jgi:hypothetical protein
MAGSSSAIRIFFDMIEPLSCVKLADRKKEPYLLYMVTYTVILDKSLKAHSLLGRTARGRVKLLCGLAEPDHIG